MAGDGKLESAAAEKGVKVHSPTFGVSQVPPLPPSALHTYLDDHFDSSDPDSTDWRWHPQ
ncbi:hypothetical protein E4U23_005088 [Claviceps purpurea]|nr:hypothetical protein E4U26_005592 [Claviceps purpurea]KAG6257478.1 hypothetical protein E4U23_005088 [Claviceps purpurea]